MGRSTFTFTLNHQKLSTTLADKLEAELHGRLPFDKYVEDAVFKLPRFDWQTYNRTGPVTAREIINVLRTEPKRADILCINIPFDWLLDLYDCDTDGYEQTWSDYGYDVLYELNQRDKCWVYGNQLGNHTWFNGMEDDYVKSCLYHNDSGSIYLYENHFFKEALSYLLILLRKLWQDGDDKNDMSYYSSDRLALATDHVKNDHLEQQADEEFLSLQAKSPGKDSYEYIVAPFLFIDLKEVQQKVQNYKGSIFIWDC
ncbi:hypothetical protein [Mucilaginibacter sp. CSA2-8R]|uniref:hypothetical protein n=1 Tax=Mucilaginibacter sp. CSA2-8R TaxID=3141542 RepID=UPI00315CE4B4